MSIHTRHYYWCLLALAGCLAGPGAVAEPTRVALIDFTSDVTAYRSLMAAADFSAALQAMMSSRPDTLWVERNQWQAAARELKLATFNNGGLAGALRLGKWVKADLLVTGGFEADPQQGRTLRMEVIDLEDADVLAECTVGISRSTNEPLRVSADKLSAAAQALGKALQEARIGRERVRAQNKVVPLFFGNVSHSPRLDFFEGDLVEAFQKAASSATNVHVLRLPRAREATGEAELVIGGLVETDLEAWQHVADVYVWGSFAEQEAGNLPFEQVPVEVTWYVWDGRTEPQQFTETITVAGLSQLARKVAQTGIQAARSPARTSARSPQIRSQVADLLATRAAGMGDLFAKSPSLYATPQGHAWWQYQVNALNAARFFEPQSQRIQKQAVIQRWAPLWATPAPPWFQSDLWAKQQCAADLAEFVDKFGLDGDGRFDGKQACDYVQIVYGVLAELGRAEENADWLADWPAGVRRDWHEGLEEDFLRRIQIADQSFRQTGQGRNAAPEWEICCSTLWDHTLHTVHSPEVRSKIYDDLWATVPTWVEDPWYVDSLRQTYAEVGRPEKGQQIIDEILRRQQNSQGGAAQTKTPVPASLLIDFPPLNVLPPQLTPAMRRVELPPDGPPHGVISLCFAAGKLWIGTQSIGMDNKGYDPGNEDKYVFSSLIGGGLPYELYPLLIEPARARLASYDPLTKVVMDLTARLGSHSKITSISSSEDKLWLTLQGNGVGCLDPRTLEIRHFSARDGVASDELYASAAVPPFLFFGGGQHINGALATFDTRTAQWTEGKASQPFGRITTLSGCKQYLLVGAQKYDNSPAFVTDLRILLLDTRRHAWTNLQQSLYAGLFVPRRDLIVSSADDNGFWLGSSSGLIFFKPESGEMQRWLAHGWTEGWVDVKPRARFEPVSGSYDGLQPTTRLRGAVTALAQDGDFLWLATTLRLPWTTQDSDDHADAQNEHYIFLFHKPSGRWVGQFNVDSRVTALAVSPDHLWIGLRHPQHGGLLEVDKRPLYQIPQANWVSDRVPAEEVDKRIAELDVTNRAYYYLLTGDTPKVVRLLRDLPRDPGGKLDQLMIISAAEPARNESGQLTPVVSAGTAMANPAGELQNASRDGNIEEVKRLLPAVTNGAALGKALYLAAEQGQTDAVKLFLAKGVDVNFQEIIDGEPRFTVLGIAATNGRFEVVKELLAHGAKLETRNRVGNTPLHSAAFGGNAKVAGLLLEHGAVIDARNNVGWTPLMFAAQCGSVDTAKVLLAHGAQRDAVNTGGYSALRIAEEHHCTTMIAFLKQTGAQIPVGSDTP